MYSLVFGHQKMLLLLKFLAVVLIYSKIISKSSEDEILPPGIPIEIYNVSDGENLPDYSIIHQIDIFKNKSLSGTNGQIIIVDESGIPKTKGIEINIPNEKFQLHQSRLKRQHPRNSILLSVHNV